MKTRLAALTMATSLLLVMAWNSSVYGQETKGALPNIMCPVMEDEEATAEFWAEYKGKKVYFCCKFCRVQFLKEPGKYVKDLPQFKTVGADTTMSGNPKPAAEDDGKSGQAPTADNPEPTGPTEDLKKEHDHSEDHGDHPHGISRVIRFGGRFHPVLIHFPIALLMLALVCELVLILTKRENFGTAAKILLPFGALGAVAATVSGLMAERFASYPGKLNEVLERHENLGIAVAVVAVVAAVLQFLSNRNGDRKGLVWAWRIILLISVILIGITAHHGGTLIYGFDHFKW